MERNSFQIKATCVWPSFAHYHKLVRALLYAVESGEKNKKSKRWLRTKEEKWEETAREMWATSWAEEARRRAHHAPLLLWLFGTWETPSGMQSQPLFYLCNLNIFSWFETEARKRSVSTSGMWIIPRFNFLIFISSLFIFYFASFLPPFLSILYSLSD